MPFKQYDHDFIDKNKKASYSIRLALLSSALIVIFNVLFLEHRDFQEQLHNNPGSYTDAIALVFLFLSYRVPVKYHLTILRLYPFASVYTSGYAPPRLILWMNLFIRLNSLDITLRIY